MQRYLSIAKYNLRFSLLPHILAALGVIAVVPVIFGITALDSATAAFPLELGLPFIGLALLTPIYSAEQDSGILSVVVTRKTPYAVVCLIRIIICLLLGFLLIIGFVLAMAVLESDVSLAHGLASFSNAVFLGGLGILASAISGNTVIGYMLPLLYYVLDLMGGMVPFTLFSMMREGGMEGKTTLFGLGMLCIAVSVAVRYLQIRRA